MSKEENLLFCSPCEPKNHSREDQAQSLPQGYRELTAVLAPGDHCACSDGPNKLGAELILRPNLQSPTRPLGAHSFSERPLGNPQSLCLPERSQEGQANETNVTGVSVKQRVLQVIKSLHYSHPDVRELRMETGSCH